MSTNGAVSSADQLLERLNDPKIASGLNRLLDQLEIITFTVESMEGFISRGEVITDSVAAGIREMQGAGGDEARELFQKAPQYLQTGTKLADAATAMDVDELAKSHVLQRLTEPETLKTLNQLLDQLPLAAFMLEALEGFIGRGDTIAENLADAVHELNLGDVKIDPDQFKSLLESATQIQRSRRKIARIRADRRRAAQSHRCGRKYGRVGNARQERGECPR